MPLFSTQINGQTIAYYTAGHRDRPPLLLIHGYISSHFVWRFTLPLLQEHFFCVAVDLIGHGQSAKPAQPELYRIPDQAKTVLALVDHLGLKQFALMGHSMGGQIALYLASQLAPERVTRLVNVAGVAQAKLVETTLNALRPNVALAMMFPFLLAVTRWSVLRFKRVARYYYDSWFADFNVIPFAAWRIDREMATLPRMQYTFKHSLAAIESCDVSPHLKHITAPVMTIFGELDAVVPIEDGFAVKKALPDSELVLIPDCGHFPMYEKRPIYDEAIARFFLQA